MISYDKRTATWSIVADHDSHVGFAKEALDAAAWDPTQRFVYEVVTEPSLNHKRRYLQLTPIDKMLPRPIGAITLKPDRMRPAFEIQSMKLMPEGRWSSLRCVVHGEIIKIEVPENVEAFSQIKYVDPSIQRRNDAIAAAMALLEQEPAVAAYLALKQSTEV